jgi:DNA-binding GntR family transcriptional regulator
VYRLRRLLEAEAIEAALPALRDEDVAHLRSLAAAVDEAAAVGDLSELTASNRQFHFALFEAAGMPRLTRLLQQLWDASDVYRALYFGQIGNRERVRDEHNLMLAAISARDTATAIRLHNEHRDHSVAWVQSQLLRNRSQTLDIRTQEKK